MLLSSLLSFAQQPNSLSNLRSKKISTKTSSVKLDSLSIVPKSVIIPGIGFESFNVDEVNGRLFWVNPPAMDSVMVTYRVFPYKLNAQVQRMNFEDIKNNFLTEPIAIDQNTSFGKGMFDFGNVNYNGS
ncbi:MAG TPA: hypothetical protein VK173_00765, partial [Lacibacter sp.]|nr:hypothetical protein [Lacibacter sp.]